MKIIKVEKTRYMLAFEDARFPGCGYSFPCDKDGHILWGVCTDTDATRKSLAFCKAHPDRWTSDSRDGRVETIVEQYRYGLCPYCGHKVYVYRPNYMGVFACECGRWYNVFGQEVLPPDEWEEF